ncbi:ankyrin repeat domain-containing protein [bacterium]|nr:ankyrin repeat domain-containing protein [bacterium]
MDRKENFYILLELNLTPPEESESVILEAIQNKQRDWSKLRNHPSKGREAQYFLSLLKEMKVVMLDPVQRKIEANDALKKTVSDKKRDEEDLDDVIRIVSSKSFVLESELSEIFRKFPNFSENEIKNRIPVSIKKESLNTTSSIKKEGRVSDLKPEGLLSDSIVKKIDESLMFLKKKDIYDFLGLNQNSNLIILRKKAEELYLQNNRVSNKTAEVTSTSELLGFSTSIFKSDESKKQYDDTLRYYNLKQLDRFIEIAGIDGSIHPAELDEIVKQARLFSISEKDCQNYVESFCNSRGWSLSTDTSYIKVEAGTIDELLQAVQKGDDRKVRELLRGGVNPNGKNKNGTTPLLLASYYGFETIAKTLIDSGADVNYQNPSGISPLIYAASKGSREIIKLLFQYGASATIKDENGYNALMWAIEQKQEFVIPTLIQYTTDLQTTNKKGQTVYDLARKTNDSKIIQFFDSKQNNQTTQKTEPQKSTQDKLFDACSSGDIVEFNRVLSISNINVKNQLGETPLIVAVKNSKTDIAKAILSKYPQVNIQDNSGMTALMHAIDVKNIIMVTELVKKSDLKIKDNSGYSAIFHAVASGDETIVNYLLTSKAPINDIDNSGNTPIAIATWQQRVNIVRVLIRFNADLKIRNSSGSSVLDLAKQKGNSELINLFKNLAPELDVVQVENSASEKFDNKKDSKDRETDSSDLSESTPTKKDEKTHPQTFSQEVVSKNSEKSDKKDEKTQNKSDNSDNKSEKTDEKNGEKQGFFSKIWSKLFGK